mgnify:CR=1 FL=1
MPEPNVYGTWVPLTGTTPADWYYVAHHVTELIFVTDFAGGVGEISGIDNPRIIPKDLGVNCFGVAPCTPTDSNGVIFVNVTDTAGCPFFTYYWSRGAVTTTGQLSGLTAGTYCVTVVNCCGCRDSCCVTLTVGDSLEVQDSIVNVHCPQTNNGSIYLFVSGGNPPYQFNWSNGATTQNITGLTAGTYTVTVSCLNGCNIVKTIVVTQTTGCVCNPPPPPPTISIINVVADSCNGHGCINAEFTGCCPIQYNILYSNPCIQGAVTTIPPGTTPGSICNLMAGNYTIIITDGCGQTVSATVVVPLANGPLNAVIQPGNCVNSVCALAEGGCPPYAFLWSNGATGECAAGLAPCSTFTVTVTDSRGCTVVKTGIVPGLTFGGVIQPSCCNATGRICAIVECFGAQPYSYLWSNGATTTCIQGLTAGTYCVTVTNANGKSMMCCYTLVNGATTPPTIKFNFTCTGTVTADITSPCPPDSFKWSNGSTSSLTIGNLKPCDSVWLKVYICGQV